MCSKQNMHTSSETLPAVSLDYNSITNTSARKWAFLCMFNETASARHVFNFFDLNPARAALRRHLVITLSTDLSNRISYQGIQIFELSK